MFNRIDCDWTLIGPPWLIPVSLGDLAGCSVQSQVPHRVISSTAPILIGADILMSGTGVWSALLNLTPSPNQCPPLSVCPSRTVQIRVKLTLYGFVKVGDTPPLVSQRTLFTGDSMEPLQCPHVDPMFMSPLAECSSMMFCVFS